MRTITARRPVPALLLAIAGLTGCAGHGDYTQDRVNAAGERMAQLKSGTEWQMAQQQFLAGDLDKALKTVDRSIALNDKVAKSHVLRGRILVEKGRMEDGRNAFLEAEKLDDKNVEAQYYLGIVHERFNDPEEALVRYQKAMELDPTNPQYVVAASEMLVQLGRTDEAERMLEARRADFQYNAALRQALGHIAMMRGQGERAVTLFNEAQLLAPDDLAIVEDLLRAQLAVGQFADAEYNAAKLLKSDQYKDRRDLKLIRARCLLNTDRPVEARAILVELTDAAEGGRDFDTWVDLGQACVVLEDRVRLKIVASRLIATAPERYEGHLFRAMLYRFEGNLPSALDAATAAVTRSSVDANPLMLKGMILQELGRPAEAQAAFAAAVRLEPDRAAAQQLLAASVQETGIASGDSETQVTPVER
jgi:Flp pilus assembly protein TadD